jgi:hypothetical protein
MYAVLVCLVLGAAAAANGALKEVWVTPWLSYGTLWGVQACPDAAAPHDDVSDRHSCGGVEVDIPIAHRWGVLASLDRSVVGEWCGSRESSVTMASAGLLVMTDRTGMVRWDQGFSVGITWPDPWGSRAGNLLARWRVASSYRVHRLVAVELAGGLQADTGEFRAMRGIFGRVGLRLGPRVG